MIKPTIGRVIWFYPTADDRFEPWPALINKVHGDRCVNVAGFNDDGTPFSRNSCQLVQDGDPKPVGAHASWMPYQVGQAKKEEPKDGQTASAQPPYQQRVIAEKADLDIKISALAAFIENIKLFQNLDREEQACMHRQIAAMLEYSKVLGERITAWQLPPVAGNADALQSGHTELP